VKQTIDLVAFDLGNVLCTVDEISAAKKLANKHKQKWQYVHEIVSYLAGALKPETAFYDKLVNESEVPADRILFIDDLEINVEGARKVGIIGLQFSKLENLETTLSSLDLI